nr:hypothetical protein BaRGS_007516 [Batillaria attramentaria]
MFFSIHPTSKMPQQLDNGLFNCSVPHYTSFSLHFDCNLETECTAGEDERNCDYTSDACGPGFIDAGNKCYRYVTVRNEITWLDAEEQCRSFGERLTFSASSYPDLRYLDASTSGMTPDDLTANVYLVRLSLSACGLVTVPNMTLPNLRWLDLSANGLHVNLHTLDLSLTDLDTYNGQVLATFPHVTSLNISHGALTTITVEGLNSTSGLEVLDKEAAKTGFHVFVTNLSVADFLMGVYLTIIGVADQVYSGQLLIFLSIRKNTIASNRGNQDATIARRLTSIALSDFLCWFPIGWMFRKTFS